MRRGTLPISPALAALVAAQLGLGGCTEVEYAAPAPEVTAFRVEFAGGTRRGDAEDPLPFPSAQPARFTLFVTALGDDNLPLESYERMAKVSVVPGELVSIDDRVQFVKGRAEVDVAFRFSFDETRIWFEDVGEDPVLECDDAFDNDGDGLIDARDPDCQQGAEPIPGRLATNATGVSETLYFAEPRIHDVQFSPRCNTDTPLSGQNVTIESGALIVTGTTQSGLYVTDLAGPPAGYNSIYLFTFSNPGNVRRGDRLCRISGNAAEFIANSQLNFPSFLNADVLRNGGVPCEVPSPELNGADAVPPPKVLTAAHLTGDLEEAGAEVPSAEFYRQCGPGGTQIDVEDASDCAAARGALSRDERRQALLDCARDNFAMEPWEHGLVAFENVTLGARFERCDTNDDGRIDFGSAEGDCAQACGDDPLCTTLTDLEQFGQFAAAVDCGPAGADDMDADGDGIACAAKFFIATRDTLGATGFDAMAHAGEHRDVVIGHLRQLQPGTGVPTTWIVEPRFIEDLNGEGEQP